MGGFSWVFRLLLFFASCFEYFDAFEVMVEEQVFPLLLFPLEVAGSWRGATCSGACLVCRIFLKGFHVSDQHGCYLVAGN